MAHALGKLKLVHFPALASPILPLQTPILYSLRQVLRPYSITGIKIRYCAHNLEDAIIGSWGEIGSINQGC